MPDLPPALRAALEAACTPRGGPVLLAQAARVSPGMIHHVLAGRRPMPASVARALGWDLVTEYRPLPGPLSPSWHGPPPWPPSGPKAW